MTIGCRIAIVLSFCFVIAGSETARSQDRKNLESDLRSAIQDKLLSLRNPYFGRKLEFDSSGNLVGKADAGPWASAGVLRVDKVTLRPDFIQIDGKRGVLMRRSGANKEHSSSPQSVRTTTLITDEPVRIVVKIPVLDGHQINEILSRVFQGDSLPAKVAGYWKPNTTDMKDFRSKTPNAVLGELEGNRPVYLVNPGIVDPPKEIYSQEPTYTETARRDKVQGTALLSVVINEKGLPEVFEIIESLGEGLDTQAIAAVAKWRYQPAMKDGKPVAVFVRIQVSFRLY